MSVSTRFTPHRPSATSVLFLTRNHAKFNAPSRSEPLFFDECNREIISLRNDHELGKTRAIFQATDCDDRIELLLPAQKRVLSIKLNSSRSVLAYHVERNIIEFYNVRESLDANNTSRYSLDDKRFTQTSKSKNSKLIGFLWTSATNLVMITDLSVEHYHVDPRRRRVTHLKMFQSATNWFTYQPSLLYSEIGTHSLSHDVESIDGPEYSSSILFVSTGSLGNTMQPYLFDSDSIVKLQKFDVEGNWHEHDKLELIEHSITRAFIYGQFRLLVLQHESWNVTSHGAQILIYTVDLESGQTSKTHTLDLDISGKFAINVLDNMVVAHDQPSKTSFIFDIMIDSTEKSDCPGHYVSLIDSRPIRQTKLIEGAVEKNIDMYSVNWVFFQPNYIVDANLGLLSTLHMDFESMQQVIKDNLLLLKFLAYRKDSEQVILKRCKQVIQESYSQAIGKSEPTVNNPLAHVSSAFEILGKLVSSAPELMPINTDKLGQNCSGTVYAISSEQPVIENYNVVLYQESVHREVFRWLDETSSTESKAEMNHFITSILLEFIFVVRRNNKNVEFCFYEQLLKCLMRSKQYYQIIQMIRNEILLDSKQLACLLLSMKNHYKPAGQLGVDMLRRLTCEVPANLLLEIN